MPFPRMPRRSSIDGEGAWILGWLLGLDALAIAWFGFGPYHELATFLGYAAGSFLGLVALVVGTAAALLGVRRRRFGRAPTNLTRNDVLGVVFAGVLGIDAVVLLALRGVMADQTTLVIGAVGVCGLGTALWVVHRLVTTARPLRAHPDVVDARAWFDWNHEFPPDGS